MPTGRQGVVGVSGQGRPLPFIDNIDDKSVLNSIEDIMIELEEKIIKGISLNRIEFSVLNNELRNLYIETLLNSDKLNSRTSIQKWLINYLSEDIRQKLLLKIIFNGGILSSEQIKLLSKDNINLYFRKKYSKYFEATWNGVSHFPKIEEGDINIIEADLNLVEFLKKGFKEIIKINKFEDVPNEFIFNLLETEDRLKIITKLGLINCRYYTPSINEWYEIYTKATERNNLIENIIN